MAGGGRHIISGGWEHSWGRQLFQSGTDSSCPLTHRGKRGWAEGGVGGEGGAGTAIRGAEKRGGGVW